MERTELAFGEAVRVYWKDSAVQHGWAEPEDGQAVVVVTLGYATKCGDEGLTVSSSVTNQQGIVCPLTIPWQAISQVQELPKEWNRFPKKSMK